MTNNVTYIIDQLPPYKGERRLIRKRQSMDDISRDILDKHKKNQAACDKICKLFWRGNARATAQYLFDFCKNNIHYDVENTLNQSVKTIAGILVEGQGDCKHYSQLITGICCSLYKMGYPIRAKYRFAVYDETPRADGVKSGHVFAVVMDRGREIWCDPVLKTFDQRHPMYISHKDKIPPMETAKIGEVWDVSGTPGFGNQSTLSGMRNATVLSGAMRITKDASGTLLERSDDGIGWVGEYLNRAQVSGHHHHHHNFFQEAFDSPLNPLHPGIETPGFAERAHIGKAKKAHHGLHIKVQPGKLLKKIGGSVSRNAFLVLMKIDAFHIGARLWNKTQHNPAAKAKLDHFWTQLGGNTNKLHTALTQAMKVWNKHHAAHKMSGADFESANAFAAGFEEGDTMVGTPVAIPALLAAAAPIMIAATNLLKSLGINPPTKADINQATQTTIHNHNHGTPNADGSVDHGNGISTSVTTDDDGNQVLSMTQSKGGAKGGAAAGDDGGDDDGSGDDDEGGSTTTKTKTVTKSKTKTAAGDDGGDDDSSGGGIAGFWDKTKTFISDHKTVLIGAGVVVAAVIIVPKILHKGKKRRR